MSSLSWIWIREETVIKLLIKLASATNSTYSAGNFAGKMWYDLTTIYKSTYQIWLDKSERVVKFNNDMWW